MAKGVVVNAPKKELVSYLSIPCFHFGAHSEVGCPGLGGQCGTVPCWGGGSQPLPQEILGNVKAWEYSWATQPHLAQAQGVALGVPARVSAGRCAPPAPLCPSFSESPFRRLL